MPGQYLGAKFLYEADASVVVPLELLAFKPPTNSCAAYPLRTNGSPHKEKIA